jgi:Secretion system C-terminal sorting domain
LLHDYFKTMSRPAKLIFILLLWFSTNSFAQNTGEVMFVGFNADGTDGFAFITFVPLPNGTQIHFNDDEWNGSAIGSGGAFSVGEGAMTWQNNTGNTISSGTVIRITGSNTFAPTPLANLGVVSGTAIDLAASAEVLYAFLGTNATTPSLFLSAIANNGFNVADGQLTNTGLTAGINAISITVNPDPDVMVYNGSKICSSTIAACAAVIATPANWVTEDGAGDQSNNSIVPDFPGNVTTNFYGVVFDPVTYYSRNATSGGIWDSPNSWTTNSDGTGPALAAGIWPASSDNVVILAGHTIVVNAITDNQAAGVSPDGLGRANVSSVIAPFIGSNIPMFYQTGDIQIKGTLSVTGIFMMTEGYTKILSGGAFTLTSSYVNLGFLEADAGSTFSSADDLILAGNSNTIINTTSISNDDLIISFTDATLCGIGVTTLTNGSGSVLTLANGATTAQICKTFTVNCTGTIPSPCVGFPVVGSATVLLGNVGPGGVGNSTNNKLWVMADRSVFTDAGITSAANNQLIQQWNDLSGNTRHATETAANKPTLFTNIVNGQPVVRFDNNDRILSTGLTTTNSASIFVVAQYTSLPTNNPGLVVGTPAGLTATLTPTEKSIGVWVNRISTRSWGRIVQSDNITLVSIPQTTVLASNTFYSIATIANATSLNLSQFVNNAAAGSIAYDGTFRPWTDLLIGRQDVETWQGDIPEVALYNVPVNTAQRTIINNYLSAKYATTLAAGDDFYTMDNVGNGNYDFDVAGIGQATDGTKHTDAIGLGMVRMWNPNNLGNGEFLIWGRDNSSATTSTTAAGTAVDGTIIKERLNRIWRASETGDVGTVSISFDFSGLLAGGSPLGSNLRLLIDRNGNGFADNDVAPIVGSSTGNIVVFSGINFQDGDRFTLGNTNLLTPLPVELLFFNAKAQGPSVLLTWSTATEINNQDFTIERSPNKTDWVAIGVVKGAGNSTAKLDYQFMDEKAKQGVQYYRLRQTDFDGAIKYSEVVSIDREKGNEITVHPNPSSNSFTVVSDKENSIQQIRLVTVLGSSIPISITKNEAGLNVDPGEIASGIYFIQLITSEGLKAIRVVRK